MVSSAWGLWLGQEPRFTGFGSGVKGACLRRGGQKTIFTWGCGDVCSVGERRASDGGRDFVRQGGELGGVGMSVNKWLGVLTASRFGWYGVRNGGSYTSGSLLQSLGELW